MSPDRPTEAHEIHTRILRCTLATEDCYAYWQHVDPAVPVADRAAIAFQERWFGMKSEARVRTIMTDMVERFDAFAEALELLRRLGPLPVTLRTWICHLHTQLADPIYRRFTGQFLPNRRDEGYATVDRNTVARWVESIEPERWSAVTSVKFGANLLGAAQEAGIVQERRDPRKLSVTTAPAAILGYALYLLRGVRIEGSLTDNLYLRSLGVSAAHFALVAPKIPGIRFAELGGVSDLEFLYPSLLEFGQAVLGERA